MAERVVEFRRAARGSRKVAAFNRKKRKAAHENRGDFAEVECFSQHKKKETIEGKEVGGLAGEDER